MRAGAITIALFLAAAGIEAGSHPAHASFSRRHMHRHHKKDLDQLDKRGGGQCQFPSDAGLVAVTPGAKNAGWAMSPDKPCKP